MSDAPADPAADRVVQAYFRWPVRLTRLFGGVQRLSADERAESRGLGGSVDLDFGSAGVFHLALGEGRVAVRPGSDPQARASISLRARVFAEMLAGRLEPSTAQMTGKVRLRGDGEYGFMLGMLVRQFRRAVEAPGVRGWPARRHARNVLRGAASAPPGGSP